MKDWLQQATGLELADSVDMFCARYDHTDYLSCHDDELEGRKIAYIFYLVPDAWTADDGGALELFETDGATGHPGAVARSLVPTFNSFAFFEVTPRSWHQASTSTTNKRPNLLEPDLPLKIHQSLLSVKRLNSFSPNPGEVGYTD